MDRILYTSTHYPANYGFIPRTYADDGDPLDVLVLCSEPIRPMSLVRVYPVGYFTMRDNGTMDDKILAIPFGDPMFNGYSALADLPAHVSNEISHFSASTSTWSRIPTRRSTASTEERRPSR